MELKLNLNEGIVYTPQEDSYLLCHEVDKITKKGMNVLDLGCGSGIQGITAAKKGATVTSADVNTAALTLTKQNAHENKVRIQTVFSDLMSAFDERNKFDLIIFNPPYLPAKPIKYIDLDGGKHGYEVTLKFLDQIKPFLSKKGKILLSISTLTKPDIVEKHIKKLKLKYKIIKREKHAWEELIIYLITF